MTEEPRKEAAPGSGAKPASRPLLASEALREEVAPVEPGRTAARLWCLGVAAVLALPLGVRALLGSSFGPVGIDPVWHGGLAAVALAAATLPLPYGLRALVMVLLALGAVAAGLRGHGPLATLGDTVGEWALPALLAAAALGAALLFRSRYRAYARARSITAAALGLALPFAGYCVVAIARGPLPVQVTSAVVLVVIAAGTLGMMGSEVALAGDWIAAALVLASTAQLGSISLASQGLPEAPSAELGAAVLALMAYAASSALGAVGLFQLLAWRHWRSARRIDVHSPPRVKDDEPSEPGW